MKTLLSLLLILFSLSGIAQDSTLYIVNDSVHSKVIYKGDVSNYFRKGLNYSSIEHTDKGYIYYQADTAYFTSIFEKNMRFDYALEDGKWVLEHEVITFSGDTIPYSGGLCSLL